ncbi:MAG TPA: hypothetical protein DIV44_03835, partial [Leeuwenhoekiella sp.]|nr:hypothetical protein [Leeuwenhoekiella sp.]
MIPPKQKLINPVPDKFKTKATNVIAANNFENRKFSNVHKTQKAPARNAPANEGSRNVEFNLI